MNFQNLPKIEKTQTYLDIIFKNLQNDFKRLRKVKGVNRFEKSRKIESEKIKLVNEKTKKIFKVILEKFPNFDVLPPFYSELVKTNLDYAKLKKSLGAIHWLLNKNEEIFEKANEKIKLSKEFFQINQARNEYFGRLSSLIKRIDKELEYLALAKKTLEKFPDIKNYFTICIFGFPNVGKSTLLSKLSTAKPEINEYAFTTKSINIGYLEQGYKKYQILDTPGTLNRLEKMNPIEKQAYLALKYTADLVIYIFDLTEPFPISDQLKLFKKIKDIKDTQILVYFSKTDILSNKKIIEFANKNGIKEYFIDVKQLIKKIFSYKPKIN